MDPVMEFDQQCQRQIEQMGDSEAMARSTADWMRASFASKYSYHFRWMGRPVIQYPQDMLAMQELIWRIRPGTIVETGIAHGGSLIFYASMMEMMRIDGRVVGVDIDIREHNRREIESHPVFPRIEMVQGSSIAPDVVSEVASRVDPARPVMVVLDSNHTHDHVLAELERYAPLVTAGSYLVVFDTLVEFLPAELFQDRPWGPGNNPMTAVRAFLATTDRFEIDAAISNKLQISAAPQGYLRCLRD